MRQMLPVLLVLAAVTGCGGTDEPLLPADLGASLAEQADAIVAALESGDGCVALDHLSALRSEAAASDEVPKAAQEQLTEALDDLEAQISCQPTQDNDPQESEEQEDEGKGEEQRDEEKKEKEKEKEKDEDEDEDDDEEGGGRGNGGKGRDS